MKPTPSRGHRRLSRATAAAWISLLATAFTTPALRAEEPVPPPKDEFPFSHRPHRAREIAWRAWTPAVFQEAVKAGTPVVVSLTATWCQKCHEMDEKAFSDPRVIEVLNRRFICIRVDTDRYPEIKDRYLSAKGWPTTAFCTPAGDPMSKVWYVEADEFLAQANAAADHWEKNRESILRRIGEYRPPPLPEKTAAALEDVEAILAGIDATWATDDSAWAAGEFRFPSPQNIEIYAWKAAVSGQKIWLDRAAKAARCTQALEDPVEFGYYRVAMRPDWSDPHFEKLLETNAGMLAALVTLWRRTGDEEWGKAASRTVEFLQATLRQATGGWGASQDADGEYFALDRSGRSRRAVPHIDGAFYSGLNAQTASAFFAYAAASGDAAAREAAVRALDRMFTELWSDAGLAHGGGAGMNLLRDLALAGDACLDAHQATGEWRWVDRAVAVAGRIRALADADGGLFDRPPDPAAPGRLRIPIRKSADNGRAAGFLVRLSHVQGDEGWRIAGEKALQALGAEARQYPAYSAEFGIALTKLRRYPLHIVIVGPKDELGGMIAEADRFEHPWKTVTVLESRGEAVSHAGLEYPPSLAAYACVADACGPPVTKASLFPEEVQAFIERNR